MPGARMTPGGPARCRLLPRHRTQAECPECRGAGDGLVWAASGCRSIPRHRRERSVAIALRISCADALLHVTLQPVLWRRRRLRNNDHRVLLAAGSAQRLASCSAAAESAGITMAGLG